jgi:3-dehydroquinate dehydratase/shikimate dehydrogenase
VDYIEGINETMLSDLLSDRTKNIIFTCRKKSDGGKFSGTEEERIRLLKKAIGLGAGFIDIEDSTDKKTIKDLIKNKKDTLVILSHHNFSSTPSLEELEKTYSKIKKLSPDIIKIVAFAKSGNDCFKIFKLLYGKPGLIAFCMGEYGVFSRSIAKKYGSLITYSSLESGKESAPGQITVDEMEEVYRISKIDKNTKVYGIIGNKAEASLSKYIHNPCFESSGINAVYVPFKVEENELKEFMKRFREFKFSGASVTIPHKISIMQYLDSADETAKKIGAVNTVVSENGKLVGHNTDCYGLVMALKEKTSLRDKKILVIGAGGSARAIIFGLKKEGSNITIVNRTTEKAKALAEEFDIKFDEIKNIKLAAAKADIIINATGVGMFPDTGGCIINEKDFPKEKIIMDIVYTPLETKLLKLAKKNKCIIVTGERMLLHQAISQFKLWTNKLPDMTIMEKQLNKKLRGG